MQGVLERNQTHPADTAVHAGASSSLTANLSACVEDIRRAASTPLVGPPDPTVFHELRGRLEAVRDKLPPLYRETVARPFARKLDELGSENFMRVLLGDPERERAAGLMLDIAQAILQNGEGYRSEATDAFQELVSDLYDGFLSAEDRGRIKPPDFSVIPALVKWGNPENGPYTWPIDATESFGLDAAIVSLPPVHAERGLLAWSAIAHEVCGHNILHADEGLLDELADAVRSTLLDHQASPHLADYWASRIDETASDVLGILNLGPAAAVGLIGYFRGLNAAFHGSPTLRNIGHPDDPHPADIVRGYLGASAVGLLQFDRAAEWATRLEAETERDLGTVELAGMTYSAAHAKNSAKLTAAAIMKTKLNSLERHSLDEIQNWRNRDEAIAQELRRSLTGIGSPPEDYRFGYYAAHVVAAAVTEGVGNVHANLDLLFHRMVAALKSMHDKNPSWGPLFVQHPGNLAKYRIYFRA